MSFGPACRPATGLGQACTIRPLYSRRNRKVPQSLSLPRLKVGFSPPGTLVRMRCEHACALLCVCTHVSVCVLNQRKTAQGLHGIPSSLSQTSRTMQMHFDWRRKSTTSREQGSTELSSGQRCNFPRGKVLLCVSSPGRAGGSAEWHPKTRTPRTSPWLCLESHSSAPSGSPTGHAEPCLLDIFFPSYVSPCGHGSKCCACSNLYLILA